MVNLEKPECNGPFLIFDVPDLPGAQLGTEHKAYYIMLTTDRRFEEIDDSQNWYTARVYSEKKVLVRLPAWDFPFFPKTDQALSFQQSMTSAVDASVAKSLTNVFAAFDSEAADFQEARKWKHYVLDFSQVKDLGTLSSKKVFSGAGDEELMDFDIVELPYDCATNKQHGPWSQTVFGFKVAKIPVQGTGARKVARVEDTTLSRAAQKRRELEEKRVAAMEAQAENKSAKEQELRQREALLRQQEQQMHQQQQQWQEYQQQQQQARGQQQQHRSQQQPAQQQPDRPGS